MDLNQVIQSALRSGPQSPGAMGGGANPQAKQQIMQLLQQIMQLLQQLTQLVQQL